MFVRSAAAAALERKKDLFSVYERNRQEEQKRMKGWLLELKAESAASLNSRLDAIDNPWPGALPTAEFDCSPGMRIPLGARWQNREQARHWALAGARRPARAGRRRQPDRTNHRLLPPGRRGADRLVLQ